MINSDPMSRRPHARGTSKSQGLVRALLGDVPPVQSRRVSADAGPERDDSIHHEPDAVHLTCRGSGFAI